MPSKATNRVLTDHEEIRNWVEERGGAPARVKGTGGDGDVGMLRIDFPGYSGEGSLEPIAWDEFFQKFDENGLALLVQDETASGERSNFNKLVSRETAQEARQKSSEQREPGRAASQTRGTATSAGRTAVRSAGRSEVRSKKSGAREKVAKAPGRSRSAKTTARTNTARKATTRSQAKKTTAARSSSRKANAKSKPRAAGKTSGSKKIITMKTSKPASSATKKSNRGHRRAA